VFLRRVTASLGLLAVLFIVLFVLEPLPVHAASSLVQQDGNGCAGIGFGPCGPRGITTFTTTLGLPVTKGDVLVVGYYFTTPDTLIAISDSEGTCLLCGFVGFFTYINGQAVGINYGTLSSSGFDTVTVTFSDSAGPLVVNIFEVAGVTTTGAGKGTGSGSVPGFGTSGAFSTSSAVSFQPGAFLVGMIGTISGVVFTQGIGFTASGLVISSDSHAQYSASGVSSPTTFPATGTFTAGTSTYWMEAALALNPPAAPAPPIPEYPLGLPILATLMIIGYGLVRRRTRIKFN